MSWLPFLGLAAMLGLASAADGDWWRTLADDPGLLVDKPDSHSLQMLRLGGYSHLQWASLDGRAAGQDLSYQVGAEVRRSRLSLKGRAFDWLTFNTHVNVSEDEGRRGGGVEFDYFGIFLANATLDLSKMVEKAGFDRLSVAYGKRVLTELNEEDATSINTLLTVERSSFSGFLVPFRQATSTTGGWVLLGRGKDTFGFGIYTTDGSREFGGWDDGKLFIGSWKHDLSEEWGLKEAAFAIGGGIQDVKRGDEVYAPWEWVLTPWFRMRDGAWELRVSSAFGKLEGPDLTTGGWFAGATVIPAYWVVEDRFQIVGRYEFMASEAPSGVQTSFRYTREAGQRANENIPRLAAGRGDFHQSVYLGFAWHALPDRCVVLGGVEWEQLKSSSRSVYQGNTFWFTTRFMF